MNPNAIIRQLMAQPNVHSSFAFLGRFLLSYMFIVAGWAKIGGYAGTAAFMESKGISSVFLAPVILLELGGGIAILLGFQTRGIAFILAVFCIISGFIFHGAPEDATNFMKNLSIAGGFIFLLLNGAGKFSLDHIIEK